MDELRKLGFLLLVAALILPQASPADTLSAPDVLPTAAQKELTKFHLTFGEKTLTPEMISRGDYGLLQRFCSEHETIETAVENGFDPATGYHMRKMLVEALGNAILTSSAGGQPPLRNPEYAKVLKAVDDFYYAHVSGKEYCVETLFELRDLLQFRWIALVNRSEISQNTDLAKRGTLGFVGGLIARPGVRGILNRTLLKNYPGLSRGVTNPIPLLSASAGMLSAWHHRNQLDKEYEENRDPKRIITLGVPSRNFDYYYQQERDRVDILMGEMATWNASIIATEWVLGKIRWMRVNPFGRSVRTGGGFLAAWFLMEPIHWGAEKLHTYVTREALEERLLQEIANLNRLHPENTTVGKKRLLEEYLWMPDVYDTYADYLTQPIDEIRLEYQTAYARHMLLALIEHKHTEWLLRGAHPDLYPDAEEVASTVLSALEQHKNPIEVALFEMDPSQWPHITYAEGRKKWRGYWRN